MEARVVTLGRLAVLIDGRELPRLASRPVRAAVLVYLAVKREASRDTLIATIWPEVGAERGRHALRQTLYELRREIGSEWLAEEGEILRVDPDVKVDALEFAAAVDEGRDAAALRLYGGRFLDGCHLASAPQFELWVDVERARFSRLHRQVRRRVIGRSDEAGDTAGAVEAAREWLAIAPWDDEAHHVFLERLIREGNPGEARSHFDRHAARLRAEGLEPLEETASLIARLDAGARTRAVRRRGPGSAADGATERAKRRGALTREEGPVQPQAIPPYTPVRRWIRIAAVGAVVLAAAAVVIGILGPGRGGGPAGESAPAAGGILSMGEVTAPAASARVLVLPFEGAETDSSLAIVGLLAADWIGEGLTRTGNLQVVPMSVVQRLLRSEGSDGAAVAAAAGAEVVVTGRVYRSNGAVELHAQIADRGGQRLWHALAPVRADGDDPTSAVDLLRQRIMSVLAARFEPTVPLAHPSVQHPPTWEAYQLYLEAHRYAFSGDWAKARDLLDRAAMVDTTFVKARLAGASSRYFLSDFDGADSLTRLLRASWDRLAPLERLNLEVIEATLRGDRRAALAVFPRVAMLYPGGEATYRWAYDALAAARPEVALRALDGVDTVRRWDPRSNVGFTRITQALHLLGRHDEELLVARRAEERLPGLVSNVLLEGRALVGLGRIDELDRILESLAGRTPGPYYDSPGVYTMIAAELAAHGQPSAAAERAAVAVARYRAISSGTRCDPSSRRPFGLPTALLLAGRPAAADSLLEACERETPDDLGVLGARAVLAAARQDTVAARAADAAIAARSGRWTFGEPEYWRAAIAAHLGHTSEAIDLLYQAFEAGWPVGPWIHDDPYVAPLRGEPRFQQLESGAP